MACAVGCVRCEMGKNKLQVNLSCSGDVVKYYP